MKARHDEGSLSVEGSSLSVSPLSTRSEDDELELEREENMRVPSASGVEEGIESERVRASDKTRLKRLKDPKMPSAKSLMFFTSQAFVASYEAVDCVPHR